MRLADFRVAKLLIAMLAGVAPLAAPSAFADEPSAYAPGHVPEPKGFHDGALHGYTPNTIAGGTVVDAKGIAALIADQHPVLLDVAEKDRKPPTMEKGMLWLPQHRSIPGAVFLEGAGRGDAGSAYDEAFKTRVAALTGNDKAKPIVTFCHPDCWGSWNAAKRLVGDGYTKVYWFPEGTEGWQAEHDTAVVKPDRAWLDSMPKEATQ